jgi:hypothetical protein
MSFIMSATPSDFSPRYVEREQELPEELGAALGGSWMRDEG